MKCQQDYVHVLATAAAANRFTNGRPKTAYGHTMCGSMVDIQSATAENRRGKKIEEEETTEQKYNVRLCYTGRP